MREPERGASREPVDRHWDDEGVIPKQLGPDTAYLFDRMTRATIEAVDARAGERVLDVGCGRGLDLCAQRGRGAQLFGSDGSRVMAARAAGTLTAAGVPPAVVWASAEHLPFAPGAFDKVYCKGAIDHFYDPARALAEMARVLDPEGRVVVSVANFDSLGCRLGRLFNRAHRLLRGREMPRPHFWEIPRDHMYRFDRRFLLGCVPRDVRVERELGLSLLWGFPHWGRLLEALPRRLALGLLGALDCVARAAPALADVIVIRGRKIPGASREPGPVQHRASWRGQDINGVGTMKRYSRVQGLLLCGGTVLGAVLFLIGVAFQSYWALAIPVAVGFLWLLGLGFWIGWTLLTIDVEPPKE
jgi:SAM-dependent methyltransferase